MLSNDEGPDFRNILVVGASKVGKTSFLNYLCHGQETDYIPTSEAGRYIDVSRKLSFIDTTGVKDSILNADQETVHAAWNSFMEDALVKEIGGAKAVLDDYKMIVDPSLRNIVHQLNSLNAIIIMYTDCPRSIQMAKALRLYYFIKIQDQVRLDLEGGSANVSGRNITQLKIFMLRNAGDIYRGEAPKPRDKSNSMKCDSRMSRYKTLLENLAINNTAMDTKPIETQLNQTQKSGSVDENKTRWVYNIDHPVFALDETNVDLVLNKIQLELGDMIDYAQESLLGEPLEPTIKIGKQASGAHHHQHHAGRGACDGGGPCTVM